MTLETINLNDKFSQFADVWSPKLVGELNGQHVKLVKLQGEFVWHHHETEDELFYVVQGHMRIELRDRPALQLGPGEFAIILHGVEHRPVADEETHIMLFEPAGVLNTGNVVDETLTNEVEAI